MPGQKDPDTNTDHCGELFPYQREGVSSLVTILTKVGGYAGALLADPPGAGKSAQAICAFHSLKCEKVLVVCPKSLKLNWVREVDMWTAGTYPAVVLPLKDRSLPEMPEGPRLVVVNYHQVIAEPVKSWLSAQRWDCLVLDESHQVRNAESHIARVCCVLLWSQSRYRIAITGTPVPNGRAHEAWTIFSRMAPDLFGKIDAFRSRYCIADETPWGLKYNRSKNLEELGRLARERFMVRRPVEVVLGQIPPLVRQTIPVDVPALRVVEAQQCLEEGRVDLDQLLKSIEEGLPLSSDPISTARKKLGLLKVDAAVEFVLESLEETQCLVIFVHHREVAEGVLEGLRAAGVSVVTIRGRTPAEERQKAVDDFQAGLVQVILLSITAASIGITLTRASITVFVENAWDPMTLEQAEGRTKRIGQTEITRAQYLVVPNSLDDRALEVVRKKQRSIERILAA